MQSMQIRRVSLVSVSSPFIKNKKAFLLFAGIALVAAPWTTVRAETTLGFSSDVRQGLYALQYSDAQATLAAIQGGDYVTSWDEFGSNALVDGSHESADIQKELRDDIIGDLRTQLTYNQEDERYLQAEHSSPEEVIAAENAGGNDLSPENYVDPNPSLEANPGVNPSALDVAADTVDATSSDTTEYSTTLDAAIQGDAAGAASGDMVPSDGEWKPSDINVFETIIDASTTPVESSTGTSQPNSAPETAPATGTTPPDASTPETAPATDTTAPSDAPAP